MGAVKLVCGRSSVMYESGAIPIEVPDMLTLGPFPYVEITYSFLRVGPEGETIGTFHDGAWWLEDDGYPYSDLNVWAEDEVPA